MKASWIVCTGLAGVVVLFGCGGSGSDPGSGGGSAQGGAAAHSGATADPRGKVGPEEMPDPNADPLKFLYWRVDRMYEENDVDADGKLSKDEFATGDPANFERMDANADGFLTKQEILDDFIPTLRAEGKIP